MEAISTTPAERSRVGAAVTPARVAAMVVAAAVFATFAAAVVAGPRAGAWGGAQKIDEIGGNSPELNTPFLDGCPIESPDGLSLFLASDRPRFARDTRTDLDIWVARRPTTDAPWGPPENLPAPVNSAADDFCPTPVRGNGLLFVSRRVVAGVTCGLGDFYFTRRNPAHGWSDPVHFACAPDGPNSALDEQGPSYVQGRLYFSRSSAAVAGDLYVSDERREGSFGPAVPIAALNEAAANDVQPSVRKDGRELVFSSNRSGGHGGQDLWVATRASVEEPWSPPVNLGNSVNTRVGETRPSLSWHADTLHFGRSPGIEGSADIYVAVRRAPSERDR